MTSKGVNWYPAVADVVIETEDFVVHRVSVLGFDTPIKGQGGYALTYKGTGMRQSEGVDIVAAVAQCYREQHILTRVKANPDLLSRDPHEQALEGFFEPESGTPQRRN
jgi:hypothetical protein